MAQKTKKTPAKAVKPKKLAKSDIVEIPETDPTTEHAATELDPEILEALNAKKVKKAKPATDVDYIPELERDVDDFDFGMDGD